MQVMDYLDGKCLRLVLDDETTSEDSVFIVRRSSLLLVEVWYLDIAQRRRELKTWDYPAANDRREKVSERLYRQTIGFD